MTKQWLVGLGAAAALLLSGCRNEPEAETDQRAPAAEPTQPQAVDDAEQVNPHTMGGTGGAGTLPNEPDSELEVGAGAEGSEFEEPQLQDEERPPTQDPNAR